MRERVVVRQKKGVGLEGDGTRFAGKGRNGSIRRSISQPNDDDNIHQGMSMFPYVTQPGEVFSRLMKTKSIMAAERELLTMIPDSLVKNASGF